MAAKIVISKNRRVKNRVVGMVLVLFAMLYVGAVVAFIIVY